MLRQLSASSRLVLAQRAVSEAYVGSSSGALSWVSDTLAVTTSARGFATGIPSGFQHAALGRLSAGWCTQAAALGGARFGAAPAPPSVPAYSLGRLRGVTGVVPPSPPTPPRQHKDGGKHDSQAGSSGDGSAARAPDTVPLRAELGEDDTCKHEELRDQLEDHHGPALPGLPSLQAMEGIRTGHTSHASSNVAEASVILQHANVAYLREELRAVSERQATIPYSQLLDLCIEFGAASGREQAEALAAALGAAGVVLRFRSQVYLRPDEVAHGVLQALPDTLQDLQQKETELEAQLQPLQERKSQIDAAAHRRSKAVMWLGFTLLVGQWSIFYWLTWYELSWDVMEPVAYFVSLGTAIGFYAYFLLFNESFDYQPLQQRLFKRWQQRRLDKTGFDKALHDRLSADLARYRRYIQHFKRA